MKRIALVGLALLVATVGCAGARPTSARPARRGAVVPTLRITPSALGASVRTMGGTIEGSVLAASMADACTGLISREPTFFLEAPERFEHLRILVVSLGDAVLVVRRPDGRYFCNDDTERQNPAMDGELPRGQYQVWVGAYDRGSVGVPFVVGVSQLPGMTTASLVPELVRRCATLEAPSTECGQSRASYGPVFLGSVVVLGRHRPWSGPDGNGGTVVDDANWTTDVMERWVGERTRVAALSGLDIAGCSVVRVEADGGRHFWRVRGLQSVGAPIAADLERPLLRVRRDGRAPLPPREAWIRIDPESVPRECGMTSATFGDVDVGVMLLVGSHEPYSGPTGDGHTVSDDRNWAPEMDPYVGAVSVVTSLEGLDRAGCPVVHVEADGGRFYWRIRDMAF